MALTVVTWNIHSAIGTDGRFDLERIATVLRELDPDVAALQEVGDFRGRAPHSEHADELARALGRHLAFAPTLVREGRRYGNAILARAPIVEARTVDLSVSPWEPRGALIARIEALGIDLACVHLGLSPGERVEQEGRLAAALPRGPLVVAGDFNHWTELPPRLGPLRDGAALLGSQARTCPSTLPLFRFDRILVSEDLRPLEVRVHRSPASLRASDHLPVVARLESSLVAA